MARKSHQILLTKNGDELIYDKEPAAVLSTLRNGKYDITITRVKEPRSLDQNSLMWMWFGCIEHETGTPQNDVHDYFCAKYLQKCVTLGRDTQSTHSRTRDLSKEEMTEFLNRIQADAATELGIRLPNPEDRYFEAFYQTYK